MTHGLLSQVGLTCHQRHVSQTQRAAAAHVLLGLRAASAHTKTRLVSRKSSIDDIARKHAASESGVPVRSTSPLRTHGPTEGDTLDFNGTNISYASRWLGPSV